MGLNLHGPGTIQMQLSMKPASTELCVIHIGMGLPHAKVNILPKLNFDHSPILVKVARIEGVTHLHHFLLEEAWITHPNFQKVIKDNWRTNHSFDKKQ